MSETNAAMYWKVKRAIVGQQQGLRADAILVVGMLSAEGPKGDALREHVKRETGVEATPSELREMFVRMYKELSDGYGGAS